MPVTQLDTLHNQLKTLRIQHRQLDSDIQRLDNAAAPDNLSLQRLKRRKLALKDTIVKLESQLIPDLNA